MSGSMNSLFSITHFGPLLLFMFTAAFKHCIMNTVLISLSNRAALNHYTLVLSTGHPEMDHGLT